MSRNQRPTNLSCWPVKPRIRFWLRDKNCNEPSNPLKTSADIEFSKLPDRSKWCNILKCSKAAAGSSLITFLESTKDVTRSDTARRMSLDNAVTLLNPR